MRCKWHKIGRDPKEEDTIRFVIFKYRAETSKIPPYSTDTICFRIGGEPECPVSPTRDGIVDAGVPNLHRQTSIG